MTKPKILVHPPLPAFEGRLQAYDIVHWPDRDADVQAAATIGSVGLTREMMEAYPRLGLVACFGVGVDGIDLDYCRGRGVAVTHARDINHGDVADVAMGLIISVSRRFSEAERILREGRWRPPLPVPPQPRLRGRRLGIVGMGAIGQAIAARAVPFGFEIRWTGPRPKAEVAFPYEPDLLTLATWADVLAVAARGDQTGLITRPVIESVGETGMIVNISRGGVVDEDALIAALRAGKLGGAGLDVFAQEPTPAERWEGVPNTTLLPHIGGATRESLYESTQNVTENLRRYFAGEDLLTPVMHPA